MPIREKNVTPCAFIYYQTELDQGAAQGLGAIGYGHCRTAVEWLV